MTVFEKVAASPETLGALLASLTVIDSPWESAFHKAFCADCKQCDCGTCPHENERNNPTWWLGLSTRQGEQAGCITLELERASIYDTLRKQLELLAYASSGKPYGEEETPKLLAPRDLVSLTVAMCRVAELMHELDRQAERSALVTPGGTMRFGKGRVFAMDEVEREKQE